MTPELLRQILLIIEEHSYLKGMVGQAQDVTYFGTNLVAIHAKGAGEQERALELKRFNDVKSCFRNFIISGCHHSVALF